MNLTPMIEGEAAGATNKIYRGCPVWYSCPKVGGKCPKIDLEHFTLILKVIRLFETIEDK
jgi:hypothetical protein